jgi:hypothetical protein
MSPLRSRSQECSASSPADDAGMALADRGRAEPPSRRCSMRAPADLNPPSPPSPARPSFGRSTVGLALEDEDIGRIRPSTGWREVRAGRPTARPWPASKQAPNLRPLPSVWEPACPTAICSFTAANLLPPFHTDRLSFCLADRGRLESHRTAPPARKGEVSTDAAEESSGRRPTRLVGARFRHQPKRALACAGSTNFEAQGSNRWHALEGLLSRGLLWSRASFAQAERSRVAKRRAVSLRRSWGVPSCPGSV